MRRLTILYPTVAGWWLVSYVALWAVVLAFGLVIVALARQVGTLHLRLGPRGALEVDEEGPPLGRAAPLLDARDLEGRMLPVGGPGRTRLLLFVSAGCPICREVLPSVSAVAGNGIAPLVLVIDEDPAALSQYRDRRLGVPVAAAPHVADAYEVPGTPYAVILDTEGVVGAKGTVNNLEQVEGLVHTARRRLELMRAGSTAG